MQVTYDTLPAVISAIYEKVANLELMLSSHKPDTVENLWFDIYGLMNYLPDQPSKQTVYGWVSRCEIPYAKRGKKLQFHKPDIDLWLKAGRRKTQAELSAQASEHVRKGKRQPDAK